MNGLTRKLGLGLASAVLCFGLARAGWADVLLFDNWNSAVVRHNPAGPPDDTIFSLDDTYRITLIQDYHWGWSHADNPLDNGFVLKLVDLANNTLIDLGTMTSTAGSNTYWTWEPDSLVLSAGSYKVLDPHPQTWSYNGVTGYNGDNVGEAGFTRVRGELWHTPAPVPEPGILALISLGLLGIGATRKRFA